LLPPPGAELRRLIREGFEQGIAGEKRAEAAGLSVPRVYQIRDGRKVTWPNSNGGGYPPNLTTLFRYADAFGITISELLKGVE